MTEEHSFQGEDRRRFDRVEVSITIVYQIDKPAYVRIWFKNEELEVETMDLSEGGMAIITDYDLPLSTPLALEFVLYDSTEEINFRIYRTIKAKGEIRDRVPIEADKYRLGICFTAMEDDDRAEIAKFVQQGISRHKPETFR